MWAAGKQCRPQIQTVITRHTWKENWPKCTPFKARVQSMGLKIARWGGRAMTSKPYSLGTRAVPKFINFFHPAWWQWQLLRWYQWRWWGPSKPWLVMDGDLCDVKDGALIDANGDQVRLYSSHFHHQPPCCHVGPGMFIVLLYLEASSGEESFTIFSTTMIYIMNN